MKKYFYRICLLMIMAVSLSLLSLTAYAAPQPEETEPQTSAAESINEDYSLLKGEITGKTILIAVAVSVIGTGITVFMIWHGYKTNGQSEPYTYKKNAPLELTQAEDVHVDTIVSRTKIERDRR